MKFKLSPEQVDWHLRTGTIPVIDVSLEEFKRMYPMDGLEVQRDYEAKMVGMSASNRRLTYREEIEMQVKSLEMEINRKKEMLQLLTDNPAIEKFMNLSRGI